MWMKIIMIQEGGYKKVSGLFIKLVFQVVLFFGAEMWVLIPQMEWGLRSFQNMVVQRLTGRKTRRKVKGRWEYPPLAEAMEEARFKEIRVYIMRRNNAVAQYIVTQPIMDLYEQSGQRLIYWVSWRW